MIVVLMFLVLLNIDVINDFLGIGSLIGVVIMVVFFLDLVINISFNLICFVIVDVIFLGDVRIKGYIWMQFIFGFFGVLVYFIGVFISNYILIYFGVVIVFVCFIFFLFFIEEFCELFFGVEEEGEEIVMEMDWLEFGKICLVYVFIWLGVQIMFVYIFVYIKEVIMGYEIIV